MRVSCVNCRIHRDSEEPRCASCGHYGIAAIECKLSCCDPFANVGRMTTLTSISLAALDTAEALALMVARTDIPRDELRTYAGRVLDALRIERAAGRCLDPTKGVDV